MKRMATYAEVRDMTNEEYHAEREHDSNSSLALFRKSPAEYHEKRVLWRIDDKQTDPQRLGTLDHVMTCEPQNFDKLVKIIPREVLSANGSKSGKAWSEWSEANAGFLQVKVAEFDQSAMLAEKVRSNPAIRDFLDRATLFEQSIFWCDGQNKRKARIDIGIELDAQIVDVKRTSKIDEFWRALRDYQYDCQAATYSDAWLALYGVRPEFWFLLVGDNGCDCCIRRMPTEVIDGGREKNAQSFRELNECKAGVRPWMKEGFDKPLDLYVPEFLLPQDGPVNTGARYEY